MVNLCLIACYLFVIYNVNPLPALAKLRGKGVAFHLFCGATLTLILLASLTGGLSSQLPLHFMGLAAAALVIGYQLTLCAIALVTLSCCLTGNLNLGDVGGYLFAGYLIPLFVFEKWRQLTYDDNIWRFSFITAGAGSLIVIIVKTLSMSLYYIFVSDIAVDKVINQYIILSPLFWLPELLFNATILITLLQHRPQWVLRYRPIE